MIPIRMCQAIVERLSGSVEVKINKLNERRLLGNDVNSELNIITAASSVKGFSREEFIIQLHIVLISAKLEFDSSSPGASQ